MSIRQIKKGTADQSVVLRAVDSTDGTPETGIAFDSAGIDLWYRREGAVKTAITEVTLATLDAAHSDGGVLHIGDGYFRLDLPDAAVATGANGVAIGGTATGMVMVGCYIHLVDFDPQDTVRAGLTALPNAAADAAGGLPISDAGGLDMDSIASNLTSVLGKIGGFTGTGVNTLLGFLKAMSRSDLTAPTDLNAGGGTYDPATDSLQNIEDTEASAIANYLVDILADTAELQTDWVNGGRLDLLIDAIKAKTDNLPTDPADESLIIAATDAIAALIGTPVTTLAADIAAIEGQTDDIGVAGAGLTAVPWNSAWDAEVESEVNDALVAIHLDHLLAVTYDPAAKPGVADALLNELIENDGGVSRFTANALEQAPGGASSVAIYDMDVLPNAQGSTRIIGILPKKDLELATTTDLSMTIKRRVAGGTPVTEATLTAASPDSDNVYSLELPFTPSVGEIYTLTGTITYGADGAKAVCGGFVAL